LPSAGIYIQKKKKGERKGRGTQAEEGKGRDTPLRNSHEKNEQEKGKSVRKCKKGRQPGFWAVCLDRERPGPNQEGELEGGYPVSFLPTMKEEKVMQQRSSDRPGDE